MVSVDLPPSHDAAPTGVALILPFSMHTFPAAEVLLWKDDDARACLTKSVLFLEATEWSAVDGGGFAQPRAPTRSIGPAAPGLTVTPLVPERAQFPAGPNGRARNYGAVSQLVRPSVTGPRDVVSTCSMLVIYTLMVTPTLRHEQDQAC